MVETVTNKDFFVVILKLNLNVLECYFLCVIRGPQHEMNEKCF